MGDYTSKLQKVTDAVLEPGERLQAGVRGMRAGATAHIVGGAAGAVAGGAVGAVIAGRVSGAGRDVGNEAETAAGFPDLPPQIAMALTDRRLLVFKRGGVSGKAKDLVVAIPRGDIGSITGADSGSKLRPDRLTVTLTDGSAVDFEVVKNDGYQAIVDAFGA